MARQQTLAWEADATSFQTQGIPGKHCGQECRAYPTVSTLLPCSEPQQVFGRAQHTPDFAGEPLKPALQLSVVPT